MPQINKAVLSLGSNIGDRMQNLQTAVQLLCEHQAIRLTACSSVYQTQPFGVTDQPAFYNLCLELATSLSPIELLDACQQIERQMGRVRLVRWGPRNIDVDIVFYQNVRCRTRRLTLPHDGWRERAFVLVPLAELFPQGQWQELPFARALKKLSAEGVQKIAGPFDFAD